MYLANKKALKAKVAKTVRCFDKQEDAASSLCTTADLATVHAEIRKLQQENSFLQKQLALKPSITDVPSSSSERTTSPTVSFLPHNPSILSKHSLERNNVYSPLSKVVKPSLTAIVRQFSSPAESTGSQLIHVPVRRRLSLQQLRPNICRLHNNTRRMLDIHYSNRNLVSFLIHIGYETELCSQLSKFNITVRDGLHPLDLVLT
ncbi:hypothetical protein RO3G_08199 [Rhizopus delemar RA 99-880]|uniref:Uncharacterized protein n=1 Tax=Rhizopus delemar (strain RA 99-880 / ATCC MYA-4621 / FGSC 9543 / NRRL 43880) TaxID=246409 RepID=I1C4W4_RHIO9|nr:hypothetical protein RO3G_08199 [Rhizopus delemar RA 99-880]|eukprot:EIE83494.1 hypothetical protein RO3G_08199 [Rhizopus delemar RA 99-880]